MVYHTKIYNGDCECIKEYSLECAELSFDDLLKQMKYVVLDAYLNGGDQFRWVIYSDDNDDDFYVFNILPSYKRISLSIYGHPNNLDKSKLENLPELKNRIVTYSVTFVDGKLSKFYENDGTYRITLMYHGNNLHDHGVLFNENMSCAFRFNHGRIDWMHTERTDLLSYLLGQDKSDTIDQNTIDIIKFYDSGFRESLK